MKRKQGFTLVELLVVVAIITILASIVVPNVADWIGRARMAKGVSEVKSAELALTKMLSDSQKSNFGQFFSPALTFANLQDAENFYTNAVYVLLRKGRDASLSGPNGEVFRDDVRKKLGQTYMDLGKDPWGNLYHFFFGPLKQGVVNNIGLAGSTYRQYPIPFRIYHVDTAVPGGPSADGNTIAASDGTPIGYPAPAKLPMYIYSVGADLISAQAMYSENGYAGEGAYREDLPDPDNRGGGDDINNWDNAQSWDGFY